MLSSNKVLETWATRTTLLRNHVTIEHDQTLAVDTGLLTILPKMATPHLSNDSAYEGKDFLHVNNKNYNKTSKT